MKEKSPQLVDIEVRRAANATSFAILFVSLMLLLGQIIRGTLPEDRYGLNYRQITAEAWILLGAFWILTLLICSIKFNYNYWRGLWDAIATGSILVIVGTAGNFAEAAITAAVTDFIPARILGQLWIININDLMIVLGSALFVGAAAIFIYKTVRWMFYYEFRNVMQN